MKHHDDKTSPKRMKLFPLWYNFNRTKVIPQWEQFHSVRWKPDAFRIIDKEGKDITGIKFQNIDSIKASIEERIYNL